MRKKADKYLYTAERYFFSAAIAMLARQDKSIYEIALLLEAHTKLIEEFVLTDELKALICQNNEAFITKIKSEYTEPAQMHDAFSKYFIISLRDGRFLFVRKFPKTLDYWLKKTRNGEAVFLKLVSSDAALLITCNTDPAYSASA
ncbi:MAG: hypothetical protein ABI855_17975, partial [Bacteroidota bacterium]